MALPPVGASVEVVVENTASEGRLRIAQRLWRWENGKEKPGPVGTPEFSHTLFSPTDLPLSINFP